MAKIITDNQHYSAIAEAIRTKNETETLYKPSEMAAAILDIQGGADLNFEVVGGTTQPSNPKENMIWVNTSTTITGWGFGAESEKPSSPASGMVWFCTGPLSVVKFNALKENSIFVYLLSANQRVSGAWKSVAAKIYQNGTWVACFADSEFVKNGYLHPNKALTGKLRESQSIAVAQKAGYLRVNATTNISGGAMLTERVDTSKYTKATLYCNVINAGSPDGHIPGVGIILANALNNGTMNDVEDETIAFKTTNSTGEQTLQLSLPSSGLYYIGIFLNSATGKLADIYVYDFYLS